MDAKITLSFNADIIQQAKAFANEKGISLSRLTEYLFSKMTNELDTAIYELPINSWVLELSAGKPTYRHKHKSKKELRKDYYEKFDNNNSDNLAAESKSSYSKKKK